MSITAWDIKEAAFASDIRDVEELILANKGATDVGALSTAVNLRSLSLAFNSLSGLAGLSPLTRLQSLNLSHNQLVSLKGLQSLTCLVSLNVSYNKVASLAPLSGLVALADLWLQNNALAAPAELLVMAGLPGLQRLAIANNPVVKALPVDHVRRVALRLCPGLRLVDGRPVEPAEREASDALDVEALLAGRPPAPGSAPAATGSLGASGLLGSQPVPDRVSSHRAYPQGEAGVAGDPAGDGEGPGATPQLEQMSSFSSATSAASSRAGTVRGAASRRPPLPNGLLRPASQLQGTQFQAVVDALPRFDPTKLPVRYSGAPRARAAGSGPPAQPVRPPPPDAHVIDYEAKYPVNRGGGRAVVVRRDGSLAASWPGGDMAVTVDADYSSPEAPEAQGDGGAAGDGAADGGGDGDAPRCSYKMMAMYRAGGVAVSWDAQGGFVQYPGGGLMLMYSRVTGAGTCYSPAGDITRRWRDADAAGDSAPPPTIALPFPLAAPRAPPPPPPPPPSHIDMQLDPHLGIRYVSSSHSLELYFSCEGLRYRTRCGRNVPGDVWEPPPGRGDSAAPGGSIGSGGAGGAHDRPASTSQAAAGDVGASARAGSAEDLSPPSFLRNLARQGGAGTFKSAGSGGSGGGGGGGGGASKASSAAKPSADAVDIPGFASIASGLQALTEGLQAMLSRGSRESAAAGGTADEASCSSPAAPSSTASKASPAKGRRGAGSGISAVRALTADLEASGGSSAGAGTGREQADDPPSSSHRDVDRAPHVARAAPLARHGSRGQQLGEASDSGTGAAPGPEAGRRRTGQGGPGPPGEGGGAPGVPTTAADDDSGDEDDVGKSAAEPRRPAIDSEVAAQLAAARRLAADSVAAALAAASAAAAIGSYE
ncbi:hypothetical protein GPECTOR_97g765 [Gonium pectorale]|uniref:Uncharacterized protein n=1 Tax=Gonium pectorale TaxID=33097 RepID=A0A150G060_GONPE|nr:hypothetical protein GPECTOR_97g765 [Gonium pectorale]|eukprot:KXZ43227.1 hypothetical protein GPECTOR_97g765 [Gonium pectorale]